MSVSLRFAGRLGQLLIAPRDGLRRIEAQGGGFRDMLWLIVVGTVCLRFPQLAEALLGLSQPSQGTIMRVVAVFSNEAREAATAVIPATLAIILLGGSRRDPTLDLELGSACFLPFFMGRALFRIAIAATGHGAAPALLSSPFSYVPAIIWGGWALFRALQVVWSRTPPAVVAVPDADAAVAVADLPTADVLVAADVVSTVTSSVRPPLAPPPAARLAGLGALCLLVVGLGLNVVWASRHMDALRPIEHGASAPEFELPRIDGVGGRLSLSSLRGKVVLLDFWATWCPPCIQMIPILHDLHAEWSPRGVAILGVSSDGGQTSTEEIRAFIDAHPAPYPMVLDDGTANTLYKIRALPQFVLIGRDGDIRRVFIGYTTRRQLAAAFADALAAGGAAPATH